MIIDTTSGERFNLALERFREGNEIIFQDIGFYLNTNGAVECRIQSSWRLDNINESRAKEDLVSAEVAYNNLISYSDIFAKIVKGQKIVKSFDR